MKTAEETLNEKLDDCGYYFTGHETQVITDFAKAYAEQAIQEVLKRAADNAEAFISREQKQLDGTFHTGGNYANVNKSSILNTEYKDLLK